MRNALGTFIGGYGRQRIDRNHADDTYRDHKKRNRKRRNVEDAQRTKHKYFKARLGAPTRQDMPKPFLEGA